MSDADPSALPSPVHRATRVRYLIVGLTTLTAVLLYLDRVSLSFVSQEFQADLGLTDAQRDYVLGAFFLTYALGQVPAGWLADRFGARGMMALYVISWSLCTLASGLATGLTSLLVCRWLLGAAQAGAYPTSAGLLSKWVTFETRGRASSLVALGGRIGQAVAPQTAAVAFFLGSWRGPMMLYGAVGVGVGLLFWWFYRERPREHPWVNEAEATWIEAGNPLAVSTHRTERPPFPWQALLTNRSMWLMCLAQFGTNVGWAFLVTLLPVYLRDTYPELDDAARSRMATIILASGIVGTFCGGFATDWGVRLWGRRWGRSVPLAATRFLAAGAYLALLTITDPVWATAAFVLVSVGTDLGGAATWAYMQDVGGPYVGAVLGWANMCGNLGAAVAPIILGLVQRELDSNGDWSEPFLLCALAFTVSGLAASLVDPRKPLANSAA